MQYKFHIEKHKLSVAGFKSPRHVDAYMCHWTGHYWFWQWPVACSVPPITLTHWGRDKMAAISQTMFLKCIFLNENLWILLKISLKFVPKGPINNIPSLVQVMAWRRPGDKPLSEPMMVSLLTHICVARLQWVNQYKVNWAHKNTLQLNLKQNTITAIQEISVEYVVC